MKIKGSVALITGGAQGIGKEICKALLERGAKVSVMDVNKQIGQEQVKDFQKTYGQDNATFISCDVANKKEMEAAFRKSWDVFGHIDIVCNNAGIVSTAEMENGFWDKIIDVNVKGVVHGTILGIKYLSTNGGLGRGGTIINVASMAGLIPSPDQPIYCATKHAVVGLTRSLEGLYSSDGIRINCICPSFTDTPMVSETETGLNHPQFQDTITAKYIRTFGLLRPELIASGVLQLIEDDTKNAAVMRVTKQKGIDYKKYFQPKL